MRKGHVNPGVRIRELQSAEDSSFHPKSWQRGGRGAGAIKLSSEHVGLVG